MEFGEGLLDEDGNTKATQHDEPEWNLYETKFSYVIVPVNGADVDRALTIDKDSLKSTE